MVEERVAKRDRAIVNCVGKLLRERYQAAIEQEIPDRLISLLHLLEQRERDDAAKDDYGLKK